MTIGIGLMDGAPIEIHYLGMILGLLVVVFACWQLAWASRWSRSVGAVATTLDELVREAELVFVEIMAAKNERANESTPLNPYMDKCRAFLLLEFGEEAVRVFDAASKKNLWVSKQYPAAEPMGSVFVVQAHLERLRSRLLLGRTPLKSGVAMPD